VISCPDRTAISPTDGASTPETAGATATAAKGGLENSIGNSQASGSTVDVLRSAGCIFSLIVSESGPCCSCS
jgi:hypothetical protein